MPADSTLIVAGEDKGDQTLFQSLPERSKHEEFIRRAVDLLVERVVFGRATRTAKVVEWATPDEIKTAIDLKPRENGLSHDELLGIIADVSHYKSLNIKCSYGCVAKIKISSKAPSKIITYTSF